MKSILPAIICCAALLPFAQVQAGGPAGKTYGGFAPGKTFTLTVKQKTSAKTSGTTVITNAPVPDGIPNYKKGQTVKFTIGTKGQLTTKAFSMKFESGSPTANAYFTAPTGISTIPNVGTVYKNSNKKPVGVSLTFVKIRLSGFTPITNNVHYTLE